MTTAMNLRDKGEIRPPPRLRGPAQKVSAALQLWPSVIAATHWYLYDRTQVDGADFYVGEKELGHIHLDGEIHLRLTPTLARAAIALGRADAFPWADDWVQAPIATATEAAHALWLLQLAYDRLKGAPIKAIMERLERGA